MQGNPAVIEVYLEAGKSTLLEAVSGLIRPAGGSIYFEGRPIAGHKACRLSHQGLILVPEERRSSPT